MQIPIVAGHDFDQHDTESSGKILVVNRQFVRRFFGGADPVGKSIISLAEPGYPETQYEIVGVVGDTAHRNLRASMPPIAYAPDRQNPGKRPFLTLVARSAVPGKAGETIAKTLAATWPGIRIGRQMTPRDLVDRRLLRERLLA